LLALRPQFFFAVAPGISRAYSACYPKDRSIQTATLSLREGIPRAGPAMAGPSTPELPFFAYGIFQKDEIAYPNIELFVADVESAATQGCFRERDGIFLLDPGGNGEVEGNLIHFRPNRRENALRAISSLEPLHVYRWSTCSVRTSTRQWEANTLVGKSPHRGSHAVDGPYRSREDPLFVEAIAEIENVLNPSHRHERNEINDFFRLQMAYLLLWAAIERYCTLRWGLGLRPAERVNKLKDEPAFGRALKKQVREERRVGRADRPADSVRLDPNDPGASIKYYYQVRSNIAHRGKTIYAEMDLVRHSLEELTQIFTAVLNDTLPRRS